MSLAVEVDQLLDGDEGAIEERKPAISAARRFAPRLAVGLCVAVAVARFLAVDIAGIVTNDSLGYLQRSQDPLAAGFVTQGYRQAAYPLVLAISTWVGDLVGWDAIFGMALLQRTMLAGAIVVTIWAMRWWSVPLVALFTSATYVIHADYLLPEGLLVPLCVLCGAVLAAVVMNRVQSVVAARVALVAIVATAVVSTIDQIAVHRVVSRVCRGGVVVATRWSRDQTPPRHVLRHRRRGRRASGLVPVDREPP